MNKQKKILICPLDWGLGHATRCVPLIAYLLEKGCEVVIAGNKITNALLANEFPDLTYLWIDGYEVEYSKSKWFLPFKIAMQIPKIVRVIQSEHRWLQEVILNHEIDLVISDNRYGLYSNRVRCIFITHQIHIQVPQSRFIEKAIQRMNEWYCRKFSAVWVPDYEPDGIAGKLSLRSHKLNQLLYIGNLSRFEKKGFIEKKYDVLVVLSGPEPQRSIAEKIIFEQLLTTKNRTLLVRGKNIAKQLDHHNDLLEVKNFLNKRELETAILSSEVVICRSGYSSVMDLIKLGKHAILLPTPGQTEQEYLSDFLMSKSWFINFSQSDFKLENEIQRFRSFHFHDFPDFDFQLYKKILDQELLRH